MFLDVSDYYFVLETHIRLFQDRIIVILSLSYAIYLKFDYFKQANTLARLDNVRKKTIHHLFLFYSADDYFPFQKLDRYIKLRNVKLGEMLFTFNSSSHCIIQLEKVPCIFEPNKIIALILWPQKKRDLKKYMCIYRRQPMADYVPFWFVIDLCFSHFHTTQYHSKY